MIRVLVRGGSWELYIVDIDIKPSILHKAVWI